MSTQVTTSPETGRIWRSKLRRIFAVISLAAFVGGLGVSAAEAADWGKNDVTFYHQEQDQWCWAAISKTVIRHATGKTPSQCQIVKWGKQSSACSNVPGDFGDDVTRGLRSGGVSNTGYVRNFAINFGTVADEINNHRNVMLRWEWAGGGVGHMLIIRGYHGPSRNVSVINPDNYDFSENVSYDWMVSAPGHHRWNYSRYNIF